MLKAIIRFSINYAFFVVVAAILLVGLAIYTITNMTVDVFPELNAPTVVIMAEAGGLSADEVEQYVTFPVETAVNGLTGIRRVRSSSTIGLSIVWVDLQWNADLYTARQLVNERLSTIQDSLPDGVLAQTTPITSIAGEIMLISISSPDKSVTPLDLRSYAEFDLRNRLLSVPGVSQVVAIGGELPEYQIHVDPDQLRLYDLTTTDIVNAAQQAHSIESAGYLPNVNSRELPIRQNSRVSNVNDIANTIVTYHQGLPITIGQVATVQLGPALQRGTASQNGHSAIILSIQKSPGTNTLALTETIDALLDQIEPSIPEGMLLNRNVMRQSHFIDRAINNVRKVMVEAVIIITVILMLFLMNIRTTLITLTALPVSVAAALVIADWMNWGINVMVLGGLAVAVGVMVDDAIIDVENVYRRLKQNSLLPKNQQKNRYQVIFDASNEIRPAMVFATIIIVMVFIPLFFLQGLEGRFFRPLGFVYVVSILMSLLVALTLTPALCRLLLHIKKDYQQNKESILIQSLKKIYRPTLEYALKFRKTILTCAAAATVLAIVFGSSFGSSFLPKFNEGSFTVFLLSPPGTSLEESDRIATRVEKQIVQISGIDSVARRSGRAERDEHAEPVSNSELDVALSIDADQHEVKEQIDKIINSIPGLTTMIGQPIEHRLSHLLSGTPAAIAINVYGDDLNQLRQLAKHIESHLKSLEGVRDVNANREIMITTLPIDYRHEDLSAVGLTPAMAAKQVQQAFYGQKITKINDGTHQYDLVVRLDPSKRQSVDDVKNLILSGQSGQRVRLSDVADIHLQKASNLITRENAQRKAVVSLNIAEGYNLGDLVANVKAVVNPIVQKAGYVVSYGGQFEAQQAASKTLIFSGCGVLILMLMLLQVATGSIKTAFLVMLNMPLSLIGGIIAMYLTEVEYPISNLMALLNLSSERYIPPVISIASLIGFITLFGISVRNGILLVNHYQYMMLNEGKNLKQAIISGSLERLTPILMTAISAALGLIPLALALGQPGSELLAPMAIVILGGLVSSTILNLVVVPAGYYIMLHKSPQDALIGKQQNNQKIIY